MPTRRGDSRTDEERAARKAETDMVFDFHAEQLKVLQDHVREGISKFDAGEIDAFELDRLIYHYSRSAKELWKFCGMGEARVEWASSAIRARRESGSLPDWWAMGDPDRRRR